MDFILWVYDASIGEYGTVYQYDGIGLATGQENALTTGPTRDASDSVESMFTDIMEHEGMLWFGRGYDGKTEFKDDLIWNDDIPNSGDSITPVNRTPKLLNFSGLVDTDGGSNSDLAGWTTGVAKGNFSVIPVDSLTVAESGGVDQCFSIPIGKSYRKWPYSSYRVNDTALPRWYSTDADHDTPFNGNQNRDSNTNGKLFSSFRSDLSALHQVCTADEIGPLFGGYYSTHRPVPWNQSPRFNATHGWSWVNTAMNAHTDTSIGDSTLAAGGISETFTGAQITTKGSHRNKLVPYEFKGYYGNFGVYDTRGTKIVDNDYDRSIGYGVEADHALRWYYHGVQTEMQFTPDDYIDKEYGLVFWASNDFKGNDAMHATGTSVTWKDMAGLNDAATVTAMHGHAWGNGDDTHVDLRRLGKTQIDHNIYSRKFNRYDGSLNVNGTDLINSNLTEGNISNWSLGANWSTADSEGFNHTSGSTESLKYLGEPDSISDGAQYIVEYDVTVSAQSIQIKVGNSTASSAINSTSTGTVTLTAASNLFQGTTGTTASTDHSEVVVEIIPHSSFVGTINNIKVYAKPKTYSVMLPTSFNNAGDSSTIKNTLYEPIGVNYTTPGYRHCKSYPSFNMSLNYNTGLQVGSLEDNADVQYHEVGTNPRTEAENIAQKLSLRSGSFGSLINRRGFNFVNPLATASSEHLNDFAGQHMPFDRHIMAVDTMNKYVFVLNPLYKGWGFPNTDLTECDTGATTTHCIENELSQGNMDFNNGDTITLTSGNTDNLWVGMTLSHADIPKGAYITEIVNSTSFKINTNTTGGNKTGQTIIFGRYISTDQGTGGNRNVVYIYSYDENGKFKYRGFKHLVRDFIHDYRGDNSTIPGGTREDSKVIATDIYCRPTTNDNFLIINTLNGHDTWDIACDDETPKSVSDATRQRRHRILKVKYSSDLLEWEVPQSQNSNLSLVKTDEIDSIATDSQLNAYNGDYGEKAWESGVRINEDITHKDSSGGGGFCIAQTAYDKLSNIMFKVINEPYNETQSATQSGRVATLYAVGTKSSSNKFGENVNSWGKLKLTHPDYSTISDLSSSMSITQYDGPYEDTNMPIDFIALDKASRVIYVGTSKTESHPDSGNANTRYEHAMVTYTSIQSFPYYPNKLGMNEGASGGADEAWNNIRKYTRGGHAIDHIVLSTIHNRFGDDNFDHDYSGGNLRSNKSYGGIYKQALVTNNESDMNIKYYSDSGEKLNNVEEVHVQDGVPENLPQGRYLILSGGGVSIPYKHTYEYANANLEEIVDKGTNSMSLLRAIPVTVDGHFIKHPEKKREQEFFRSNFLDHGNENGNPWDITSGTFTLTRTNSWGMFSSEGEKTLDEVDSTDPLHHDYKHCIKDQDLWYHSRNLDGPLLGFHEHTGTLFTMAGMRASDNEINSNIKHWDFNLNSTDHDKTGRQFRLYSINLMHHEPISSPLANLIPIGPDSSHKFGGVLFGLQSRNMTANRIIKTSTLESSASEDDRKDKKNTLQTLTTAKGRFIIAAVGKEQAAGTSDAMYTAGNKADGAAGGESRLFGIGQNDIDVRLNDVNSMSIYNRNNQIRSNNVQIIGINQVYDDTKLNSSSSVDYRYLFTFSYNSYFDANGLFNKSGLGILSAHASDPFESAQITGALAHGTSFPIRHNRASGQDRIYGHINLITPYALGIKHGTTGADVTSAAKDLGVHFLIGNAYDPYKQKNSYQAGWALGALKYTSTSESNLLMKESQAAGTGGKLADTLSILPVNSDTGDWSEANRKYFYRASFVYDGYQEGPLGDDYTILSDGHDIKLTIRMDTASLSKRATHLNIYRGDNESTASHPLGFYRLVEQIRLDTSWSLGTDSNDSPQFSNFRFVDYTDTGKSGADYESNSGIPEVVDDSNLKYHYSCELNNQLYVAKIGHRMVDNGESTIAKSLPYNYDMFDITKDVLRMPCSPTAIGEHGNRIWVFDEGNAYKIEPSNLYIEETFKGSGCFGNNSYVSTEHGLFYCDNSNIYAIMQDGIPRAIGTAIKTGSSYSWDQKDLSYTPIVGYDGNLKTIFFAFKTNSKYYAWGYNIVNTRWDLYKFNNDDTDIIQSFTNDKYGNLLFNVKDASNNHYLYQFGTDTTKHLDWEWVSKNFTFGHDNVYKKVYNVVKNGSGVVTYDIDSAENPAQALDSTKISTANRKTKQIKLKVLATSNSTNKYELDSLGIIFRRLKVTAK